MRNHELQNIAGGIASAFVGRNDDHGGYWAMGLLRASAARRGVGELRLPLVPSQPCDEELLDEVARRHRVMLERALSRRGARGQVVAAVIAVRFLPAPPGRPWPAHLRGLPAGCEVRLRERRAVPPRKLPWPFAWIGSVVTLLAFVAMSVLPLEIVQPWARGVLPVVELLQPRPAFGEPPRELPEQFFWMVMSVQWPACGALIDAARRAVRREPVGEHHEATT